MKTALHNTLLSSYNMHMFPWKQVSTKKEQKKNKNGKNKKKKAHLTISVNRISVRSTI